jgi:diguanylate cyclase (GGDEF)-like protein/PAS domain S-box-containing protein
MSESKPIRILYMEDEPGLARLFQKRLERAGYVVDIARNGEEGLAMYEAGSYNIVAVDQAMPVHTGLDVIRLMASQGPLPPMIMVTGTGSEQIAVEAMKLGAGDYLVKDVDGGYLELLPTVIERVLQQQRLVEERQLALAALQESEARYRGLFDGVPVGLYQSTPQGQFLDANPTLVEMLRYPDWDTLLEANMAALYVEAEDFQLWRDLMERDGVVRGFEVQFRRRDGPVIWVRNTARVVRDADGQVLYYEGSLEDITKRRQAEREIEERRRYLEGVLGAAPDAIVTLDARHRVVEWNPGAERLFGYSQAEVIGQNIDDLVTGPDTFEEAVGFTQTVMSGGEVPPTETIRYRKDGSPVDVTVAGSPILVEDELIGVVAVYTDITQRKRAEAELAYMATHDALTGLPNRRLFNDRLTMALAHAYRHHEKVAVMLLDLDHFKDINDTLGHSVGDQLLRIVAARLTSLLRQSDTVARMGGDEFILVLPELARVEDVTRVAQKILEAFREPFVCDGHELHITTSIGIAIYPYDGEDADTLMKNADIAMYRAKDLGRDSTQRYTPPGDDEALD